MKVYIGCLFYLLGLLFSSSLTANSDSISSHQDPSSDHSHSQLDQSVTDKKVLLLNRQQDSYSLYGYMHQFTDRSTDMELSQALTHYQQSKFKPLKGFLNLGYTQDASWVTFQFKVPDTVSEHHYLWLSPSMINYLDVYIQNGADANKPENYQYFALGDHRSASDYPYQHSKPLVALPIEPGKQYRVFIRTQTTSTHGLRAWIRTEKATINESNKTLIGHVAIIASSMLLGIIAWLQAIRLRNGIQFWYGLYLLSESLVQLGVQGLLPVLLPDIAHYIADWITGGLTCMAYISLLVIAGMVLNSRQEHPWYHRYLITLGIFAILAAINANNHWYGLIMSVLMPAGIFVMPIATILYYRKFSWQDPSQRLFFLFFLICSLGVTVHLLRLTGVIPINNFTYAAMMLNTLVHMVVLNLALSEKLLDAEQKARSSAEASEGKAIALAEEMTQELLISKQQLEKNLSKEQQAVKEQSRFIDMISHEYRTPLAIIKTNLDILDLKAQPDWQSHNNLQAITQATERLQEIFDTEIRQGHMHYQIEPKKQTLPAVKTLQQIFADANSLWPTRKIQLKLQTDSALDQKQNSIDIHADTALLKTLIFNLLDNAQKYSPAGQSIDCTLTYRPSQIDGQTTLRISISNFLNSKDAIHIDTSQLCEKYTRGGNRSGSSGLGLGLYLVKHISEAHNGRLELSITEDKRFVVQLTLPATDSSHSKPAVIT